MDLESPKKISGVITQGAKDFGSVQFVSAFKVAHSDDGRSWTIVKDESTRTDKVRTSERSRPWPSCCTPGDGFSLSWWSEHSGGVSTTRKWRSDWFKPSGLFGKRRQTSFQINLNHLLRNAVIG